VVANRVSPGWLPTVRIPLLAGRDFTWSDRQGSAPVAIVNETLARQFWSRKALGQRVLAHDESVEVIGIARDSKYRTIGEATRPLIYLPLGQGYSHFVSVFARTSDRATAAAMTSELQRLLPDAKVEVQPLADAVAVAVLPARIGATGTGLFGGIAVALAAFGVYGLVSFSVIQRTREIGIRRAIGASVPDIVRLVVRQHALPIGLGLAIGVITGALGATLLRSFLTGVEPTDPIAVFTAVALVASCALAASISPAVGATRVDPMVALRNT
jgi:hypothetical protein